MELYWNFLFFKMGKMEAFRCSFIIPQKPIHSNRLFSLFAELLRTQSKVPGFELQYFFIL